MFDYSVYGPLEKGRKREEQLLKKLDDIVSQLKNKGAEKIILFGSLLSGDVWSGSDIDLLVVMPSNKLGKAWRKELERDVALDLLVFN